MQYLKNKYTLLLGMAFLSVGIQTAHGQFYSRTIPNLPYYDEAKYHFGFYLGGNQMMFVVKPNTGFQYERYHEKQISDIAADSASVYRMVGNPSPGFCVGMVSVLRMGKYFELRFVPGLQFGERSIDYTILTYIDGKENFMTTNKSVVSTYINAPLHLKYKAVRIHNLRPYIYAGPAFKWDLSSQRKKNDNPNDLRLKMSKGDIAMDVGVGFDFYTNWFKFGVQLEMSFGFNDILTKQDHIYAQSIESVHSKIFQIIFTFE
ncbi:MAG: PorT family protein [Bacteroidales bacterium]|nr:PorT family protein [Bacteroidales bacterium]